MIRTAAALNRLVQSGRPIVVRPWVDIQSADRRSNVRLELRVHVVAGCAVAVEYLFPAWSSQRPTEKELQSGRAWTEAHQAQAAQYAERVAAQIDCRWFVADFAGTADGLRLIELNAGWCSGIATADAVRAVHRTILNKIFQVPTSFV